MIYSNTILLINGKTLLLRNGTEADAKEVADVFQQTHEETDFLLSYPDEINLNSEQEAAFLKRKTENEHEIEIVAFVDGIVAGMAGIEKIGNVYKVKHRAEFGICVLKKYWGMGIGRALMNACIECARRAGYIQLEILTESDNERAFELYKSAGFVEYGRNPKGVNSRVKGFKELIHMRLEL